MRSPALFPKDKKLVCERVWIDPKTKKERHSLWLVTGKREQRKPLEKDEPEGRSPVVSPDGEWIAFLSTREDPPGWPGMMYGLTDIQSWTTWELGGLPWEQPERYRKHSPLTYAHKVKTPTLILHARDDRRCPLPMGKPK